MSAPQSGKHFRQVAENKPSAHKQSDTLTFGTRIARSPHHGNTLLFQVHHPIAGFLINNL